jgi:hypothetical protein
VAKMARTYKLTVLQKPYTKYTANDIKFAFVDLENGLTFLICSKKLIF